MGMGKTLGPIKQYYSIWEWLRPWGLLNNIIVYGNGKTLGPIKQYYSIWQWLRPWALLFISYFLHLTVNTRSKWLFPFLL